MMRSSHRVMRSAIEIAKNRFMLLFLLETPGASSAAAPGLLR